MGKPGEYRGSETYQEWLKASHQSDSPVAREWWICPEGEEIEFIKDHPEYFGFTPEEDD